MKTLRQVYPTFVFTQDHDTVAVGYPSQTPFCPEEFILRIPHTGLKSTRIIYRAMQAYFKHLRELMVLSGMAVPESLRFVCSAVELALLLKAVKEVPPTFNTSVSVKYSLLALGIPTFAMQEKVFLIRRQTGIQYPVSYLDRSENAFAVPLSEIHSDDEIADYNPMNAHSASFMLNDYRVSMDFWKDRSSTWCECFKTPYFYAEEMARGILDYTHRKTTVLHKSPMRWIPSVRETLVEVLTGALKDHQTAEVSLFVTTLLPKKATIVNLTPDEVRGRLYLFATDRNGSGTGVLFKGFMHDLLEPVPVSK